MALAQPTEDTLITQLKALQLETQRRTRHANTPYVYRPLFNPSRYKGIHGGRGSGKSHFFAELLIDRCFARPTRAVCVREFQVSLEQSVKRLLEDKIHLFGYSNHFRIMNTHIETPRNGVIIFQGMKNHTAQSIKSLEGYDVAWVEEAQMLSETSLTLLRPTIRKDYKDGTTSEMWFSWNPRFRTDPVDRLLRDEPVPHDAIVVQSTYRDNPHFTYALRREMEWDRSHDPEKYAHVWLGEYERHAETRVFKNWRVEPFETPDDVTLYFGADWGYSIDPSTLVRCWLKDSKTLMIDYEAYQVGCEVDHLPALFDSVPRAREWEILADSARPETISYLNRNGYPRMQAAAKGPNSVKEGVIFLQGYDIIVHPRCIHTIDELTMYSFKCDQMTGVVLPVLEDAKNHVIDALRYAVEKLRHAPPFDYVKAGMTSEVTW